MSTANKRSAANKRSLLLGVPKEIGSETRVALVPESVERLKKRNFSIQVAAGAGLEAGFTDSDYQNSGAEIIKETSRLYGRSDLLLKVQPPQKLLRGKDELVLMKKGSLFVGLFWPLNFPKRAQNAAARQINILAMDSLPRITKAQRMDVMSSQTNLAGYKAVILAAHHLGKIFPLLMTAAGTISPARVVILGAGVAGLQAIATARRLGAIVEVSDVRPAVKEQVESLGARYIELLQMEGGGEGSGGYAKEASKEFLRKQQDILKLHIAAADIVITTALVPGKKAPLLVTKEMIEAMRPGSVIIDMAAEQGGNCALTKANKEVNHRNVKIIGVVNLPGHLPHHASQLYSRNITSLLEYLTKDSRVELDLSDEIIQGALIVHKGKVIHPPTKELLKIN